MTIRLFQERYSPEVIKRLLQLGIAKEFPRLPSMVNIGNDGWEEATNAINEYYKDRIDITLMEEVNGVPVRILVAVDRTDGVPWMWAFTFNETLGREHGAIFPAEKVEEALRLSCGTQYVICTERPSHFSHSPWPNSDLFMVNILNADPADVITFTESVEALAHGGVGDLKEWKVLWPISSITYAAVEALLKKEEGITLKGLTEPYPSWRSRPGRALRIEATKERINALLEKYPAWMLIEDTVFVVC